MGLGGLNAVFGIGMEAASGVTVLGVGMGGAAAARGLVRQWHAYRDGVFEHTRQRPKGLSSNV